MQENRFGKLAARARSHPLYTTGLRHNVDDAFSDLVTWPYLARRILDDLERAIEEYEDGGKSNNHSNLA